MKAGKAANVKLRQNNDTASRIPLCASVPTAHRRIFERRRPDHRRLIVGSVRTPSSGVPHSVAALTLFSARLALTQSGVASSLRGFVMQSVSFAARSVPCDSYHSTDRTSSCGSRPSQAASMAIRSALAPNEITDVFSFMFQLFKGCSGKGLSILSDLIRRKHCTKLYLALCGAVPISQKNRQSRLHHSQGPVRQRNCPTVPLLSFFVKLGCAIPALLRFLNYFPIFSHHCVFTLPLCYFANSQVP